MLENGFGCLCKCPGIPVRRFTLHGSNVEIDGNKSCYIAVNPWYGVNFRGSSPAFVGLKASKRAVAAMLRQPKSNGSMSIYPIGYQVGIINLNSSGVIRIPPT